MQRLTSKGSRGIEEITGTPFKTIQKRDGRPEARITVADEEALEGLRASDPDEWPRFDEWRGGLGFRLPIARKVIQLHGGQIYSPPSKPGRPAAVVLLPLAQNER